MFDSTNKRFVISKEYSSQVTISTLYLRETFSSNNNNLQSENYDYQEDQYDQDNQDNQDDQKEDFSINKNGNNNDSSEIENSLSNISLHNSNELKDQQRKIETSNEEEEEQEEEQEEDDNEIYLSLSYSKGTLACSYYDLNRETLFQIGDITETTKYEIASLLIRDLNPYVIITSSRSDYHFINFLKMKCKYEWLDDYESLVNKEKVKNQSSDDDNDDDDDSSDETSDKSEDDEEEEEDRHKLKYRHQVITLALMANNDFNYEIAKERILSINSKFNRKLFSFLN
jgi:hypothetical protein